VQSSNILVAQATKLTSATKVLNYMSGDDGGLSDIFVNTIADAAKFGFTQAMHGTTISAICTCNPRHSCEAAAKRREQARLKRESDRSGATAVAASTPTEIVSDDEMTPAKAPVPKKAKRPSAGNTPASPPATTPSHQLPRFVRHVPTPGTTHRLPQSPERTHDVPKDSPPVAQSGTTHRLPQSPGRTPGVPKTSPPAARPGMTHRLLQRPHGKMQLYSSIVQPFTRGTVETMPQAYKYPILPRIPLVSTEYARAARVTPTRSINPVSQAEMTRRRESWIERNPGPDGPGSATAWFDKPGAPPTSPVTVVIDSGATVHLFKDRSLFQTLEETSTTLSVVGGENLPVGGVGTVHLLVPHADGTPTTLRLSGVFYVPQSPFNLLSVGKAEDAGIFCDFRDRILTDVSGQEIAAMERTSREYRLRDARAVHAPPAARAVRASFRLASKRLSASTLTAPLAPHEAPTISDDATAIAPTAPTPNVTTNAAQALVRLRSPEDHSDRMLLPSVLLDLQQIVQEKFDVELFSAPGNQHLPRNYTLQDDAFTHTWTNASFYANPPFEDSIIKSLITKAYHDWLLAPETTSFTLVLPEWESASWHPSRHPPTGCFTLAQTYEVGSELFTAPPAEPGGERVLLPGTHWPVQIWHLAASSHVMTTVTNDVIAHMRLGHIGGAIVSNVLKRGNNLGLRLGPDAPRISFEVSKRCRTCQVAKGVRPPHRAVPRERSDKPFQLVYADFMGPLSASATGARYVFAIRDDLTRWTVAVAVPSRKDAGATLEAVFTAIRKFAANYVRDEKGEIRAPLVSCIQTDCAKEFLHGTFPEMCAKLGIMQRFTVPHEHRNNYVIERTWKDLQATMRTILHHSGLDSYMWPHALYHSVYLANRLPGAHGEPSPYFALTQTEPDLSNLRIWGCPATQHLVYDQRVQIGGETLPSGANARKLADRGRSLIFVGFEENSRNTILVSLSEPGKLVTSGLVANFDEQSIGDQRYHAAAAENIRSRAEFNNSEPDAPMLRGRVAGRFAIVDHRTMREPPSAGSSEDIHAIFRDQ
jgi:hypothetical protein